MHTHTYMCDAALISVKHLCRRPEPGRWRRREAKRGLAGAEGE